MELMSLEFQFIATLRLLLAAVLTMVIGLERESVRRRAGLRTHMLVGMGACLFTIASAHGFPNDVSTSRVASNIVVGIGFLGAGTIIQMRRHVFNLTTAASIWVTASIGMIVGTGAWFLAINATLVVWFVLAILWRIEPELVTKTPDDAELHFGEEKEEA